jgi:hypothetical protein
VDLLHVLQKCAKEFVLARMEAARSNVRAWEEFKLELQNSVRDLSHCMMRCTVPDNIDRTSCSPM